MAWFEREPPTKTSAPPARFLDVSTNGRRLPSWIAGATPARPGLGVVEQVAADKDKAPAPPSLAPPSSLSASASPSPSPSLSPAQDSVRHRPTRDMPSNVPATSRYPSRTPSRISMSPSELESRILEQAAQRTTVHLVEQAKQGLLEALESIDQARRDMLYGAEPRLIELAILIAKRIIAREVKTQPDIVADLVREGMDALAVRDTVRVHLGPGFQQAATAISEQLAARGIDVDIRTSSTLPEYGCVVETDLGRVDEGIETRLDILLESIDREAEG